MEYMDIRVRMPISKLGTFIQMLPDWAQMVGYDKLKSDPRPAQTESNPAKPKPRRLNGKYVPRNGTTVDAVLTLMTDKSLQRNEVFHALKDKHAERAISSAFQQLRNRGLIQKQTDGSYVVKKG